MSPEQLHDILEVAMHAVSTCNNQPWRFRTRGEELDVFVIRVKNFFLKLEGNIWIELGTLLENLSAAAAAKGFKAEYVLFERCGLDAPAATVKFIPILPVKIDIEAIKRRCTNRRPYRADPLPASVQESIFRSCDDPNIDIQILVGTKKESCVEILTNLEMVRMGNQLLIEEVLPYVRVDQGEIEEHRDRLDVRAMEYDAIGTRLIRWAKKYPQLMFWVHQAFLSFGFSSRKKLAKPLNQSGALIALLIRDRDQNAYVNLGRTLQRILNRLTEQNVQTYTVVSGLYLLDLLKENLEIYSEEEQIALLRYQYDLQSFFNFHDRRVALFIKAGYAVPPRFRTLRKRVQEVMLNEKGDPIKSNG